MAGKSKKTPYIEALFNDRWDSITGSFKGPSIVTLADVKHYLDSPPPGAQLLSSSNPANFFKDFTRRIESANLNWPQSVTARGFTANQVTTQGACFDFVPIPSGQAQPFVAAGAFATSLTPHFIESASMPVASRGLGRSDEPWLLQVVVRLKIIETYLTLFSSRSARIVQVDHLQMSVKHYGVEIDALYLVLEHDDAKQERQMLVTCEAKGIREDVNLSQLIRQANAGLRLADFSPKRVMPISIKAVGQSRLHVVEYETLSAPRTTGQLNIAAEALFELRPSVPGIGGGIPRARTSGAARSRSKRP